MKVYRWELWKGSPYGGESSWSGKLFAPSLPVARMLASLFCCAFIGKWAAPTEHQQAFAEDAHIKYCLGNRRVRLYPCDLIHTLSDWKLVFRKLINYPSGKTKIGSDDAT